MRGTPIRFALALSALVCTPAIALAYPARTANDRRIDREIGDGNGVVDEQEHEVAHAAYLVYRSTGMVIRPRLVWLRRGLGGLATADRYDRRLPRVYISRSEPAKAIRFTVFHEAGHIAHRHPWTHGDATAKELWAWEYAGRLIAATGSDILAALVDVHPRQSPIHGTPTQRVRAMWRGYWAAGGRSLFSPAQREKLRNLTPAQREQLIARLSPRQRELLRAVLARLRRKR